MKQSYADLCLERAAAATPGPWNKDINGYVEDSIGHTVAQCHSTPSLDGRSLYQRKVDNSEFIAHSRTDIVILAERLKETIQIAQSLALELEKHGFCATKYLVRLNELEAMPEGER